MQFSQQLQHRIPIITCGLFQFDWTLCYSVSLLIVFQLSDVLVISSGCFSDDRRHHHIPNNSNSIRFEPAMERQEPRTITEWFFHLIIVRGWMSKACGVAFPLQTMSFAETCLVWPYHVVINDTSSQIIMINFLYANNIIHTVCGW